MAKIVKLGHNIDLQKGVLNVISTGATGTFQKWGAWGRNALQTVTITRRTPFNPQQAIGYKGIVDYTSSPFTSDVTLDCILTEGSVDATGNSVYNFADDEVVVGKESYVLTSCALNFQAGNPATVNYGYITAGNASELDANLNPKTLQGGEEARFAVVMGEDGSGIYIFAEGSDSSSFYLPAGVQTLGFNATLNRNQILDVRSSEPVQFITTYPLDLSVNLEVLQSIANDLGELPGQVGYDATAYAANLKKRFVGLKSIGVRGGTTADYPDPYGDDGASAEYANKDGKTLMSINKTVARGHESDNSGSQYPTGSYTDKTAVTKGSGKLYVSASGLMKTEDSESVNVGGNLTYTYQFTAADIEIPLDCSINGSDSTEDPGNDY